MTSEPLVYHVTEKGAGGRTTFQGMILESPIQLGPGSRIRVVNPAVASDENTKWRWDSGVFQVLKCDHRTLAIEVHRSVEPRVRRWGQPLDEVVDADCLLYDWAWYMLEKGL